MKKLIVAALLGITTTTKATTITDNLIVWECPHCGAKASERERGSWNTFGAVFWSDCFRIAPMALSQDIVSRCWKCKKVFAKWQAKHKSILGPSAIAVKTSDADSDFPRRKIHDLELEVLEVA